jgi:hypothetical protein
MSILTLFFRPVVQVNGERSMIVRCYLGGLLSLRRPLMTLDTEIPRVCNDEYIRSHLSMPSSSEFTVYAVAA